MNEGYVFRPEFTASVEVRVNTPACDKLMKMAHARIGHECDELLVAAVNAIEELRQLLEMQILRR